MFFSLDFIRLCNSLTNQLINFNAQCLLLSSFFSFKIYKIGDCTCFHRNDIYGYWISTLISIRSLYFKATLLHLLIIIIIICINILLNNFFCCFQVFMLNKVICFLSLYDVFVCSTNIDKMSRKKKGSVSTRMGYHRQILSTKRFEYVKICELDLIYAYGGLFSHLFFTNTNTVQICPNWISQILPFANDIVIIIFRICLRFFCVFTRNTIR